eukprot:TRINITY_DN145_c0_g2_i1.p1 TRINITY_DN145_c0_g2~~TRINITY_DN145_c0_g2_i1.p1  ORF type:complete len:695 (-),score=244.99 TRINITY_DN145_c0_g2_i1:129-2075(-)
MEENARDSVPQSENYEEKQGETQESFTKESTSIDKREQFEKLLDLGLDYRFGENGTAQDIHKSIEIFNEILQSSEKEAKRVHQFAALSLGQIYELGEVESPIDFEKAMKYYNYSAAFGNAEAHQSLAFFYSTGKSVPVNEPLALLHQAFAVQGGDRVAETTLGYKYLFGHRVPKSCEKAVIHYEEVAAQVVEEVRDAKMGGISFQSEITRLSEAVEPTARNEKTIKEDDEVIKYYEYHAAAGDPAAQVMLGTLYMKGGYGLPQDLKTAFEYFQLAADQDHPAGLGHVAFMHAHGFHVPKDVPKAIELYRLATEKGNPLAQTNLGFMYMTGNGVPMSFTEAFKYFKLAADQGYSEGQLNLGILYYNGDGIKQDYTKALKNFGLSAQQGNIVATYYYAQMHQNGFGTTSSCSTAVTLYKQVVERGSWFTEVEAAFDLYMDGYTDAALILYEQAAEQGHEISQTNAAFILDKEPERLKYYTKDKELKRQMAFHYYRNSAEQKNPKSMLRMGDFHYYGIGTQVNFEMAALYYQSSSELRNAQATFNLGYMHQFGIGLPRDLHLAKRYYDLSQSYDPDAFLAVWLSLARLGAQYIWEGDLNTTLQHVIGFQIEWDTVALVLLGILLSILLFLRNVIYYQPEPVANAPQNQPEE